MCYDIPGREITTLVNAEKPSGYFEVNFNANNLSRGIYFLQNCSGQFCKYKEIDSSTVDTNVIIVVIIINDVWTMLMKNFNI